MLNELHDLSVSMDEAGIARSSWHTNYRRCPQNKTFFLLISNGAVIRSLEPITDVERITSIRKFEVANGVSFPAFNVPPLLHAQTDQAKMAVQRLKDACKEKAEDKDGEVIVEQTEQLWAICSDLWSSGEMERIEKCLKTAGLKDRLAKAMDALPEDFRAIPELISRSAQLAADNVHKCLKTLIRETIRVSQDADDWIDTLLVSTAKTPKKVSIVLELADRSHFPYPANHPRNYEWINAQIMAKEVPAQAPFAIREVDAFGKPIETGESEDIFPSVNLPKIGKVILRAMSSESPCQKRYGRIDAAGFPVAKAPRQAMKDALEWLGDTARKGVTWADASGACGFTKRDGRKVPMSGLFLVYPSSLKADPPELAGLFFREGEPLDPQGTKFESTAARVTSALRLKMVAQPDVEVRILVLLKADKARTKVLVSQKYDVGALICGAKDWQQGCRNIPPMRLNLNTDDKPEWVEPVAPFPGEVVKCLNIAWLQNGEKTELIHGLGIGEGVALFLDSGSQAKRVLHTATHLAVVNASPLLVAVGHADHRRDGLVALDKRFAGQANLIPGILGLLLHKQNHAKGKYMQAAPFLVGKLLALSDLLHKEYCLHVRGGQIPLQLVGNALMSSAIDNPQKGLARLQERLRIYQAWANTAQGDGLGLAKWALRQLGDVSSKLALLDLPERTNDADKAQMLLGYLARVEDGQTEKMTDSIEIVSDQEVPNVR